MVLLLLLSTILAGGRESVPDLGPQQRIVGGEDVDYEDDFPFVAKRSIMAIGAWAAPAL